MNASSLIRPAAIAASLILLCALTQTARAQADAENDAIYLPLKQGANELVLAVSELGGGWGFIGRLEEVLE